MNGQATPTPVRVFDRAYSTTFRTLLLEARQELAREYLNRPDIDVAEVAYLLGYEDSNSFYRAFRTWEGRHLPS